MPKEIISDNDLRDRIDKLIQKGETKKTAVKLIAKELGEQKNRIYQLALELDENE